MLVVPSFVSRTASVSSFIKVSYPAKLWSIQTFSTVYTVSGVEITPLQHFSMYFYFWEGIIILLGQHQFKFTVLEDQQVRLGECKITCCAPENSPLQGN